MKKIYSIFVFLLVFNCFSQNKVPNKFSGKLANVHFSFGLNDLSYCSFYNFKIDGSRTLDHKVLKRIEEKYKEENFFNSSESGKGFLLVKSLLSFSWKGKKETFVSYSENNDKKKNFNTFFSTNSSLALYEVVKEVLRLENNAFWEFYNTEDNQEYPEINILKPQVQNIDGVLNINKLAKVIRENQEVLDKYLK